MKGWQRIAGGGALMRAVPQPFTYDAWLGRVDAHLRAWGLCLDDCEVDARAIWNAYQSDTSPIKVARKLVRDGLHW
jgi:hypothetical protein